MKFRDKFRMYKIKAHLKVPDKILKRKRKRSKF